jgi:effector-binding domain-containing protein
MDKGYLYVLKNKSFQEYVVKIGLTRRDPNIRAKEIYCGKTGVPEPFDVAFACSVIDCVEAENTIHKKLSSYRVNDSREFFQIPPSVARNLAYEICSEINSRNGEDSPIIFIDEIKNSRSLDQYETYQEKSDDIYSLPIDLINESPIGTSKITESQNSRIKILCAIFHEVFHDSEQEWNDSFSRDTNPEPELRILEHIAKAFLKVDQIEYLGAKAKKEAYAILLSRSHTPPKLVLERIRLRYFSPDGAKKIMAGYELSPSPLKIAYRKGSAEQETKIINPKPMIVALQSIYSNSKKKKN